MKSLKKGVQTLLKKHKNLKAFTNKNMPKVYQVPVMEQYLKEINSFSVNHNIGVLI